MALEVRPGPAGEFQHVCPLPWPVDAEVPEGHVCNCGRRWVYQPAHWSPLLTLDELAMRQEAGAFLRGIIPRFDPVPSQNDDAPVRGLAADDEPDPDPTQAQIVPIRAPG